MLLEWYINTERPGVVTNFVQGKQMNKVKDKVFPITVIKAYIW